jgi:hypothetical protein
VNVNHYDRAGNPIPVEEWIRLTVQPAYYMIGLDWLRGWLVCTMWVGTSTIRLGTGLERVRFNDPPLIYETMVWPPCTDDSEGVLAETRDWYPSEANARLGHASHIEKIMARLGASPDEVTSGLPPARMPPRYPSQSDDDMLDTSGIDDLLKQDGIQ